MKNIRVANLKFAEYGSVTLQLKSSEESNEFLQKEVTNYIKLLENREEVIELQDSTNTNLKEQVSLVTDEKKSAEKKLKKEKVKFIIAVVGAGILGILAILN
jgi:hypothetical protein